MVHPPAAAPLFQETQHFSRWLPIMVGLTTLAVIGVTLWFLSGEELRKAVYPLIFAFAASLLAPFLVLALKVETRVYPDHLYVRLRPFPARRIRFEEIASHAPRAYRPLLEYGGWGIRMGPSGMAYNARGNQGVQLVLTDGSRVLIGSQDPEGLNAAITAAKSGQTLH